MKKQKKAKPRRIRWISISLIALLAIGMFIYSQKKEKGKRIAKEMPAQERKPLDVYYEVVRGQSLSEKINAIGSLRPDEEVNLAFEASGMVVRIYFKEGTMVHKGDLLAKINDLPLQAQLKKLEAEVPLAQNRVYRQQTLLEKEAVSQEALEQVKTELDQLKADIELVKSQILQTELRAPFDGYIGLRMISDGSYVSPTTIISQLTKISPMKIDFAISEKYVAQVHNGTKVLFKADGDLQPSEATVYALESGINPDTRTRSVRAVFPNKDGARVPGAFVSVEIVLNEIAKAIAVPSQAIIPELGVDKVFLYKSGKVQSTKVAAGLRTDARTQILLGLKIGDTLLTSGMLQLREGMQVNLIK